MNMNELAKEMEKEIRFAHEHFLKQAEKDKGNSEKFHITMGHAQGVCAAELMIYNVFKKHGIEYPI